MRTIDFKQYNEKLKINPIDLNDFDKINQKQVVHDSFSIDMIDTYDIVKVECGEFLMAFKTNTNIDSFEKQPKTPSFTKMIDLFIKYDFDMFIKIDYNNFVQYLKMSNFKKQTCMSESPTHDIDYDWNIVKAWKAPNDIRFNSSDSFVKNGLLKIIDRYNYTLIFENENH